MLRNADIYDIPRINELGSLLHDNFAKVYSLNEMLHDGISKVIVYESDEQVVGFIIATDLGETCDILSIVVDPNYRGKMIGSNLISYLISDLGEDIYLITLEVATKNEVAIHLYDNFGFEVVNTRKHYYKDDDAYLMALRLNEKEISLGE